jgi:DNA-binding NtrC family response regulator
MARFLLLSLAEQPAGSWSEEAVMSDAILLVDDEPSVLSALCRALRYEAYEVVTELSGERALERLDQQSFKVVVSDERMAIMQGSEFLGIVRKRYPGIVRILLTGHATLDAAILAVNEGGIYKFLTKPWNDDEIRLTIRSALQKHDAEQEAWRLFGLLQQKQQQLSNLETHYPGISQLKRDETGSLLLPDISDDELDVLRSQCEQLFMEPHPAVPPTELLRKML